MPGISQIQPGVVPKMFKALGGKITNEPVKQAIEAIGTAGIAPLAIIMSPGPRTKEAKNEKKYQALRQIPSIILKYGLAFIVAVVVGKHISKAAWKSYLPKGMKSKLCLKADKVASADELLQKIGLTNVPQPLQEKLTQLHGLSKDILASEAKKKDLYFQIENLLDPIGIRLSSIQKEKDIVVKLDHLMDVNKTLQGKREVVTGLKVQYKELRKLLKDLKKQATHIVWDVRGTGPLTGKTLNEFDKYVLEYEKDSFRLYRQMFQAGVALATLPISAFLLNVVYPPFVKLAAPKLAKEVEEANR